jgi:hypothetical protein
MQSCSGDDGNGGFWLMAGEAHISTIALIMTTKRLTSA